MEHKKEEISLLKSINLERKQDLKKIESKVNMIKLTNNKKEDYKLKIDFLKDKKEDIKLKIDLVHKSGSDYTMFYTMIWILGISICYSIFLSGKLFTTFLSLFISITLGSFIYFVAFAVRRLIMAKEIQFYLDESNKLNKQIEEYYQLLGNEIVVK